MNTIKKIHDTGVELKSKRLENRQIALGISGSIGAVETIKIIRELRRHGAVVTVFTTPAALKFITALSLEWASGKKIVSDEGAEVEHLISFDLVLIAPATLNTISKCSLAIADNAVTLLVASHLGGGKPLLFFPAMNGQMQRHPAYQEHAKRLSGWGAEFFFPNIEEDRLKMPSSIDVAEKTLEKLS